MPDTTKKNSKKNAPILCAIIMIALLATFIGVIIFPLLGESYGNAAVIGFLIVYSIYYFIPTILKNLKESKK